MDSLEIMLKEYDALRQEVLAAMSNRISILSFGIAAVAAILLPALPHMQISLLLYWLV